VIVPSPGIFYTGLCCGTPLPDARIEQAVARGFTTFRANLAPATPASFDQFAKYPCTPLWIVGQYGHTVAGMQRTSAEVRTLDLPSRIELGNEPNIGDAPAGMPAVSPYDYAGIALDTRAEIEARGHACYYGSISSLNPDALAWLAEMLSWAPWIRRVSVHRYPYRDDQDPSKSPHGSRANEMAALLRVLNSRRVLVTETGIQCPPVDEARQLAYLQQEVGYWRAVPACDGVIVWVEGNAPQESYGLREGTDGRWREAGRVFLGPPVPMRAVAIVVYSEAGQPVPDAACWMQTTQTDWLTGTTGADGVLTWPEVPAGLSFSHLKVEAEGYVPLDVSIVLDAHNQQVRIGLGYDPDVPNAILLPGLTPAHFDPSTLTLEQLAQVRGAMWTARCNVSFGPRPYQDSNILALNYYHLYGDGERQQMLAAYLQRGYTHGVCSVPLDEGGYHHMWPSQDYPLAQERWDAFLDSVQERCDAGIWGNVFFAIPDELQDYPERWGELEPFFLQERAQRLLRIAILAWEPLKPSAWWVNGSQWLARVFPKALRGLHFTPDHDAPGIGGELMPDGSIMGNDEMWRRVAPYIHIFPHQSKQFEDGEAGYQSWLENWNPAVRGSYPDRFDNGYAGWPTFSAWGYRGILAFPAEYLAWWCTNQNEPEATAQRWGDGAISAGARGYLDGGTRPV